MKTLSNATVRNALSAHSAVGLLCCALLYLICITGTVVVLYEEWHRIEQPRAPEMAAISPQAVQNAIDNILADEAGNPATTTHLYVHLPSGALPRTTVTTDYQAVHVDANGAIAGPEENAWSEFLLNLHYTLHLPTVLGMTIVGMMGALVFMLALSGIMAHPRIFRDAFRLRMRRKDDVAVIDWHNRIAVWSLPFALAVSLTGGFIGMFYVSGYGLAAGVYDGNAEAVTSSIFGTEPEGNADAAETANVIPALAYMAREYPDVRPYYVILHDAKTAGQHVQIIGEHRQRLIYGESYSFDAQGNFLGAAGLADGSLGQQLAASTYNLHFGNYGGLPVKIAYILFGIALSSVVATGTYIWLNKRARRGLPHNRLRAIWHGFVWGVPSMLGVTLAVRLALGNSAPFVPVFWLGLSGIVIGTYAVCMTRQTASFGPINAAAGQS